MQSHRAPSIRRKTVEYYSDHRNQLLAPGNKLWRPPRIDGLAEFFYASRFAVLFRREMHLLFVSRLYSPDSIDGHGRRDPMQIRRDIVNFSLTRERAPKPEASVLHEVIDMQSKVLGAMRGNRMPQELPIFLQKGIEPRLDFELAQPAPPFPLQGLVLYCTRFKFCRK